MLKNSLLWLSIASLMYFGFSSSLDKSTKIDCEKYGIEKACKTYEVKS